MTKFKIRRSQSKSESGDKESEETLHIVFESWSNRFEIALDKAAMEKAEEDGLYHLKCRVYTRENDKDPWTLRPIVGCTTWNPDGQEDFLPAMQFADALNLSRKGKIEVLRECLSFGNS